MFDILNMFRNYKQLPDRPNICSKKINQIKRNLRINSTLQFVSFFTIFPYGNEYNLASNLLFKYRGHRIRSGGHLFTLVLLRYQRHTFRNEKKAHRAERNSLKDSFFPLFLVNKTWFVGCKDNVIFRINNYSNTFWLHPGASA